MTYTQKLMYILAQGKPNMNKFTCKIESIIKSCGYREWVVVLTLGQGRNNHVIYKEYFTSKSAARLWADKFMGNNEKRKIA